jgi:tetratricopeptide (TPR) repeat protein
LNEAIAMAERLGDPGVLFSAFSIGFFAELQAGNLSEADRRLERASVLAEELGQPDLQWILTYLRADRALLAGHAAEAERLVETAYTIGRETGQSGAGTIYAAGMQSIRWHQGRQHEVVDLLAETAAADPDLGVLQVAPGGTIPLGGDAEDLAGAVERMRPDASWDLAMTIFAERAGRARDAAVAASLYDGLVPFGDKFAYASSICRGPIAHYLGILATVRERYEDAEAHFGDAAALNERMQAPFHLARTQLEWARMLSERAGPGDIDRARALLEQAAATAHEFGCAQVERRAHRLLDELASRP